MWKNKYKLSLNFKWSNSPCGSKSPHLMVTFNFYISRYHFSQIYRISFNIIWKKIFVTNLHFFNGFTTQAPHGQFTKTWTKLFTFFLLTQFSISSFLFKTLNQNELQNSLESCIKETFLLTNNWKQMKRFP